MWPRPRRCIRGRASFIPYMTPCTLMSTMRLRGQVVLVDEPAQRHDPGVVDQHVERAEALLDLVEKALEGVAARDVELERDRVARRARRRSCSASSRSRSPIATLAPLSTSALAVALPIPRAPPVIATTFPLSERACACHRSPPRSGASCGGRAGPEPTAGTRAIVARSRTVRIATSRADRDAAAPPAAVVEPGAPDRRRRGRRAARRARSRPGPTGAASRAPGRWSTTRCRCCSRSTRSTGRSSACGSCTPASCSCSGPEANHYVTVSHPQNFLWREGSFGDLIPLLGDGLLTIDGAYHDRARRIMMPAFHRERIEAVDRGDDRRDRRARVAALEPGAIVDVYDWARNLAMRIAMRALLGPRSRRRRQGAAAAASLRARARLLRHRLPPAPAARARGSPWRRLLSSRAVLDEIVLRRDRRRRRRTRTPSAATSSAC